MFVGELLLRLACALIGFGWFSYHAWKLGKRFANEKALVGVSWVMVPYRIGCMLFGISFATWMLIAGNPQTERVTVVVLPKTEVQQ